MAQEPVYYSRWQCFGQALGAAFGGPLFLFIGIQLVSSAAPPHELSSRIFGVCFALGGYFGGLTFPFFFHGAINPDYKIKKPLTEKEQQERVQMEHARRWQASVTLGAKQGNAPAQNLLGDMYLKGQGVPQDYKAAVHWYTLSAEQGYADAQGNLGAMYSSGHGVLQDYVLAHMWRNLAASNGGGEIAVKARDALASMMTPAQLAEAQALAKRCLASKYKDCGQGG